MGGNQNFLKSTEMIFDKLKQFRQSAYMLLGQAKDAVCDLIDAVLTTPKVKSFVVVTSVSAEVGEYLRRLTDGRPTPEADEVILHRCQWRRNDHY